METYLQTYPNYTDRGRIPKFVVAIYKRVSGKPQAGEDKESLNIQEKDMLEFIRNRGWRRFDIYQDVISGALYFDNRPDGKRLMDDARQGKFNVVMVWDYDRLGRDIEGMAAKQFRHDMRELGIQVYSLHQPRDLKDPNEYKDNPYDDGEILLETIHDWQSSSTVSKFKIRSMKGKEERARKGKMLNTPPYGYKLEPLRDENGQILIGKDKRIVFKRVINEEEKPVVIRIYNEYVYKELSMNQIRDRLNNDKVPTRKGRGWERAMVSRILKNPVYFGALIYNRHFRRKNALTGKSKWGNNPPEKWIEVPPDKTEHKPIVDKTLFDKAQEIRKSKLRLGAVAVYNDFLFSGLGKCKYCGSKLYRTKVRSSYTRKIDNVTTESESNGYICGRWQRFKNTERNYVSEHDLKNAVINDLKKFKDNPLVLQGFLSENDKKEIDSITDRLEFLKLNLSKVSERYARLSHAYQYGTLSSERFNDDVEKLDVEEKQMQDQVIKFEVELDNKHKRELSREDFKRAINNFDSVFYKGSIQAQKAFLRSLIENILVGENKIQINYSI